MGAKIGIDASALDEIDKILRDISVMEHHKVLKKGIRKAANVMKKRYKDLLPTSGSAADDGSTPLSRSISVKVQDTENGVMAIVGEKQKGRQFHAHLIEEPHRIVSHGEDTGKMTTGNPYGQRAADQSRSEMDRVLVDSVRKAAADAVK